MTLNQETKENVLSECCGAKVTESGFCTDCHDHCVGEDMTCEAIQDQEQKYGEPDQDYTNYRDSEINSLNAK